MTTLPNVTINNFICPTDESSTEVVAPLKPHVETSPHLIIFLLLYHLFDLFYQLQCKRKNSHLDFHLLAQVTSFITAFIQELTFFQIPTPTQGVDTQIVST